MENVKWVWMYIRKYKLRMCIALIFVLVASALCMVPPYVSGIIIDKVIKQSQYDLLLKLCMLMLGATVIKSIIRFSYQIMFETISQGAYMKIRESMYQKLQNMDFKFFDTTRTGDIMARMTGDMETVRHLIAWVIYMVFENATIFIFAVTLLFTINWQFTLVMLLVVPFLAWAAIRLAGEVRPTFAAIREQFSRLNSVVQENISGNRVIKAFATEYIEISKFDKENEAYRQRNMASAKVWSKYLPVIDALAGTLSLIILIAGGILTINNKITIGELVTFNSIVWALGNPMRNFGWLINDIQRFNASADKIREYLNNESEISNIEKPAKKEITGFVEFRNVSFGYDNDEVLKNVSLNAKPGETVAIIGPTGSGKSTLVNLICRFYDCSEGEVLVDNVNVKEMDLRTLRSKVSVAMQDVFLFSDTIEGNIAYGVPDAPYESIKQAAGIADADGFISSLPEGYDTIIGERGVGLSGGQRQRIALARAILKDPSILILDDTTSSVDMETEFEIHRTLRSFYNNKTTFIIAHRISSVKNADKIIVLNGGQIIEQGTHKELLNLKGYYYDVYQSQYGDFDGLDEKEVG
ncbi:ABC transporter transmembrane region [Ruminiclostridium papyrosolvens DSM 2782]|uniref:ABC transporter transmembrane region n=1 Tax=Ruminiclostridium papyrosolvens DSM 2782 TaxID=588581 RepID=F1T9L1_9FIRM|nr:ABC transporter ATP-binding protein [Ruminiclostridium papyrosolvens]EGD49193.1 ABC transporter transmembrane region [Ruminiclostridium papyrosolvens DSM 2782]WES35672.1 ABC transporter ATP-binding protein [Ruminiclostridium papyrosolvens DSM 2782]